MNLKSIDKEIDDLHKLKLFMQIFNKMFGPLEEDVPESDLFEELEKTNKFKGIQEMRYLRNLAMSKGLIYERKAGWYATV